MKHIVLDLEMNKIPKQLSGSHKLSSELIEIGAVKLDDKFEEENRFQTYVANDYGKMDARIIKLTGITDDKLEGAPRFAEAMDMFVAWIGEEEATFYSWSMCDLRQFQQESAFKSYDERVIKMMERNWVDFQEEFCNLLGISHRIKLKQAVNSADYEFSGAQHTALADAVNTAGILRLSKDKKEFERVMKPVIDLFAEEKKTTLLDMCPDFFASLKTDDM